MLNTASTDKPDTQTPLKCSFNQQLAKDDVKRHQQKNSKEDKPENMEVVKPHLHTLHILNLMRFQETSLDASETPAEKSTSKHLDREHSSSPGHTELADQTSISISIRPYSHHRGAHAEKNEKSWRNPKNIKFMGLSAFKKKKKKKFKQKRYRIVKS